MICHECQSEIPKGSKVCKTCGKKFNLTCSECGKSVPPESKFCLECGHHLEGSPALEKPIVTPDAERKQITALFSDLTGYTAMTGQLDPEDVREITGKIFQEIKQVVARYDGFIEKFAGDGALILFGVPQAHEDDAVRAIRTAREIHDCVDAISPIYARKIGHHLTMHSGINTGLALTADVDSRKSTHGVTGEAINIAARLSDIAKAGQILVGHETFRQAERHFVFEVLEATRIKGKADPIQVYEVTGAKERLSIVHRLSGMKANLIGRGMEMAQLSEAVNRLRDEKTTIITISGDAGTGKSRLVEELRADLDIEEIHWLEGHAYAYAQNIPYFLLINLLNHAFRIEEADGQEQIRNKIESKLEPLIGKTEHIVPYIGGLFALRYPEAEGVSPEFWKSRLFEAVQSILGVLTCRGPTIIGLEDMHWADPSSLELFHWLLSDLRHPVLFLCVYRLPFSLFNVDQLSRIEKSYVEIRLQELSPSDTQNMMVSLLNCKAIPMELRRFVLEKVDGNPFYVEEVINSLIESGTLIHRNSGWILTRPITEMEIPSSIQGVISARLDHLEKEMKRILQEASVIGRTFLYEILKRITELKHQMDRCLHGLEQLDLVRIKSSEPELEYIFKHALTQDVAYNGLLKKQRQELHELIALVMEQLFENRLSECFETLAFHFKQGQSVHKAVEYLLKSGEKCLKKYAVEESDHFFKEAYDLLVELPGKKQAENELLVELLIKWSFVFHYRGDFLGLTDLLTRHKALAIASSDQASLGMYYTLLGLALYETEKIPDAYKCLREALVLGEETGEPQVIGYACSWLTWVCPELGLFHEAINYGERAKRIAAALTSEDYLFFNTVGGMGVSYYLSGDLLKGFECGQMLLEHARRYENIRSKVLGHFVIGCCHLAAGDIPSAIESLQQAIEVSVDPWYSLFPRLILGVCLISSGRFQEAKETLGKVLEHSLIFGTALIGTPARSLLAVTAITEGRLAEGLKTLQRLQGDYLSNKRLNTYAVGEHMLGKIYSQLTLGSQVKFSVMKNLGFLLKNMPFARRKAQEHFKRSIKVSEELGAKCVSGMAYLDLGLLYQRMGKKNLSRDCLIRAKECFELSGAEAFLGQADASLRSSGQPEHLQ